jgi:radical SAM protein with 4Fe4S-binding SPASM domain
MSRNRETLDFSEIMKLARFVRGELQGRISIRIILDTPLALYTVRELLQGAGDGRCNVRNILGILGSGEMALCGIGRTIPELCFGNLRDDSLIDMWMGHPTLKALREDLKGPFTGLCGRCIHAKDCLTSCVAENYMETGRLVAPSRLCAQALELGVFPETRLTGEDLRNKPDPLEIVQVHASAVGGPKGAAIFLGPSGAGKSKISELLGNTGKKIADDKVFIASTGNGTWVVSDSGSHGCRRPDNGKKAFEVHGAPLKAIVRIHQAKAPRLEPMDALTTCMHLTHSYFEIPQQNDANKNRHSFAALAQIARAVKGYTFYFDLSEKSSEIMIDRGIL